MKNGHFNNCAGGRCGCELRRYLWVLVVSLFIAAIELVGAYLSDSLALASDAFHVLTDAVVAGLAIAVATLARIKTRKEYFFRKVGGFVNVGLMLAVVVVITKKAVDRMTNPPEVLGLLMLVVAIVGAVGNYIQHRILSLTQEHHLTQQGLHWHVLADLAQSLAVIIGAIFIITTGYYWIDIALSFIIVLLIIHWSTNLLRATINHKAT